MTSERDAAVAALKIARRWMHMEADLAEFESFPYELALVDDAIAAAAARTAGQEVGHGE